MELFRRLQNYYDAVKYLRNLNIARNRITLAEVPAVSSELQSLLERCDSEWQKDALQLRAELNAISGSFFELEFDRVNEKLNLLTYEKDKLRDLMRARVEYLDAVRDFVASADISIDIAQMATPSDSPQPLQEKAKELCKDLETKAEDLKHLQAPAEMIISDLIPQQLIRKFRWQLIGPSDEDTKSLDEAARYLEELISRNLPSSQDPQQFLSVTQERKHMEEEESKAFDEMTELAILDEYKPSALDAPLRVRLRSEFADLQRKAFSLDGKIGRSMISSAKQRRHKERLQTKLTQLESWLDAMENDTDVVERMLPGDEQTTRLTELLISCLGQQRLVGKLQRLSVQNRDHVQQLCQKYYIILNRLRSHNLDESALPIHVGTLVQGAPTCSQPSISSLASSEFADRPESVQSVDSSIGIAAASADSELPMRKPNGDIRRKLHILIQLYNDAPENLATSIADYNLSSTYRGELKCLFADALENSLHHLTEHLNETAGKLQKEIYEEVSLSAKEEEIVRELTALEQRVKGRDVADLDVVHDLEQLQAQMDLLRMINRKPRRFVESDLMERGEGSSRRSRSKRKVLVMVTNTATTIIQVVEERLLTIEARSRDPVVQQKLDLVKIDIAAAEKSLQPHLEMGILATAAARGVQGRDTLGAIVLGVEQALHIADNIDLESCDDPNVLSESLHILEGQSISMNALCNTASELAKDGDPYYLDTIRAGIITVPKEEQPTTSSQFQVPALRAQLSMLQERHEEANHARKHVDPDSSRLSMSNDRMKLLTECLHDTKSFVEKEHQDRLIALIRIRISELLSRPRYQLSVEQFDDIEKQIETLPKGNAEELRKQIEDLRKQKDQHDNDRREIVERLAKVDELIITLPTTRDIPTVDANLARMRDARDSLATLPSELLADENLANQVESRRKAIYDLSRQDEENLQKMLTDRDMRNNAIESLEQLQRDIEELESVLPIALPSSSELNDFKQSKTPKLFTKLNAIVDIPVDLLQKKEDLSNRIDIINKKLDEQVKNMKNFEQKTDELQKVVDDCRDKVKTRDASASIDEAANDEKDLSSILVIIESIPQEDLSTRNQLAQDVNSVKQQVKSKLATLRKVLSDEEKAREKENDLKNRLSVIDHSLNTIDPRNEDAAKQLVTSLEIELQQLAGVAESCHQFAASPSSVVSHDDLDKTLPEKLQKLQKVCDEKKRDVEQVAQLNAVAPEILLISESLQQQPDDIPQNLNEQQSVLEELETKKQRLENLIQIIPEGDASEELRQKSVRDLSKLKDFLKRLGDSVGDKLAALAAFNAARADAEDQLLLITGPDAGDRTSDELKKDEESLYRLQQSISQLENGNLDDEQRNEHAQLLDRINKALIIIKQRRSDVDEEIARRAADETLKHTITPVSTRLVQLVNDADRLIEDAEGAPTQYRPSAEELSNECKKAVEILRDAPKTHPSVESLETALTAAENMIPVLEERANYWDEFVKVRDEADVELDKLRQPLEEVIAKPRRTVNDAKHDFDVISLERQKSDILGGKVRRLQELSELLDPLESAYADVRFIDVDAEQTEKEYDDVLNELSTEIEDENLLCDSVDHFVTQLNSICESLAKQPSKETIENIEQFQIPALQARLSKLQERHEEANHARKHVDPDSRLSMLNDRLFVLFSRTNKLSQ
ncbi:hypothetical protein Q1695_008985 [Nippostrongylus brasiliensis]|nr:hypothetical protein Q1695_008985 [Nippostrongylus brasiliensis]